MIDVKRVTKYCCEDISSIEGYEEALCSSKKEYVCHHRLETHNSDGERRLVDLSIDELKALNMYYNRPAYELVFMTNSEHTQLHHKGKIKGHLSEEHKRKIVETRRKNGSYRMSEETKEKLRNANKGKKLSEEHKAKISESHKGKPSGTKGKKWFNNGIKNVRAFECPNGFVTGRLPNKTKNPLKGKSWKIINGRRTWVVL